MEFPIIRPSRKDRIYLALDAMHAVDAMNDHRRATTSTRMKTTWLMEAMSNPQVQEWAGGMEIDIPIREVRGGRTSIQRGIDGPSLVVGVRNESDLDMALIFGYASRMKGLPRGERATSGTVHDSWMLMMMVAGLWVHSPSRAKELWLLLDEMKLRPAVPSAGWKPRSW